MFQTNSANRHTTQSTQQQAGTGIFSKTVNNVVGAVLIAGGIHCSTPAYGNESGAREVPKNNGPVATAPVQAGTPNQTQQQEGEKRFKWVRVNEQGIGAKEFALKHFGTPEWQYLVSERKERLSDPRKLRYGIAYTMIKPLAKPQTAIVTAQNAAQGGVQTTEKKDSTPGIGQRAVNLAGQTATDILRMFQFNLNAYKASISIPESGGKYDARNDLRALRQGVPMHKAALGKYQFSFGTLEKQYGLNLRNENGKVSERKIVWFLQNQDLQEKLMNSHVHSSVNNIISNDRYRKLLSEGKISIVRLLAMVHHGGPGALTAPKKDWMGMPTVKYAEIVTKKYQTMAKIPHQELEPAVMASVLPSSAGIERSEPEENVVIDFDLYRSKVAQNVPAQTNAPIAEPVEAKTPTVTAKVIQMTPGKAAMPIPTEVAASTEATVTQAPRQAPVAIVETNREERRSDTVAVSTIAANDAKFTETPTVAAVTEQKAPVVVAKTEQVVNEVITLSRFSAAQTLENAPIESANDAFAYPTMARVEKSISYWEMQAQNGVPGAATTVTKLKTYETYMKLKATIERLESQGQDVTKVHALKGHMVKLQARMRDLIANSNSQLAAQKMKKAA